MDDYLDHDFIDEYYGETEQYNWMVHCFFPTLSDAFQNFYLLILIANLTSRLISIFLDIFIISKLHSSNSSSSPVKSSFLSKSTFYTSLSYLHHVNFVISGIWLLRQYLSEDPYHVQIFIWILIGFAGFSNASFVFFQNILHSKTIILIILKTFFFTLQFFYIALNEYEIHYNDYSEYIKLRPLLMLIVMKSVAFIQDQEYSHSKKLKNSYSLNPFPMIFNSFAYLFHPSSIILGVWHYSKIRPHMYDSFQELFQRSRFFLKRFFKCFSITFISLIFSSCLVDYIEKEILLSIYVEEFKNIVSPLFPESFRNIFDILLTAYFVALKFHCSHFFICFAAESMFSLWEIDLKVSKPFHILVPYSMVQLVISWNIPIHVWLKRYIFKPLHNKLSTFFTILATYLISSFLHGLNCQIWTVLLTLGICTQSEFKFRSKMSKILSSCIDSKPCKIFHNSTCDKGHYNSGKCFTTKLLNLFFSIIVITNLIFLGSTFDGDPESASCSNVYFIWSNLYFFPYIIAATQGIYLILLNFGSN